MADLDNLLNECRSKDSEDKLTPASNKGCSADLEMNSPGEQQKLISSFLANKGGNKASDLHPNPEAQKEDARKRFSVKTLEEKDLCKPTAFEDKLKDNTSMLSSTFSSLKSSSPGSTDSDSPPVGSNPKEEILKKRSDLVKAEDLRKKLLNDLMAAGVDNAKTEEEEKRKKRKDSEIGEEKPGSGHNFSSWALFLMLFLLIPAAMLIVWLLVGLATSPISHLENIDVEDEEFSMLSQAPEFSLVEEFLKLPEDSELERERLAAALEKAKKEIQEIVSSISDERHPSSMTIDVEEEMHVLKDIMDVLPEKSVVDGEQGDEEVPDIDDDDTSNAKPGEVIEESLEESDPHNEDLIPVSDHGADGSSDKKPLHPSQIKPTILQLIYINILRCRERGDIVLGEYIRMYRQLNAFLSSFGSFATVQTQMLEDRIKNLEFRHRANQLEYKTLSRMIRFEDAAGTVGDIDPVSGSIVFTCLQRHLQYLSLALHAIIPLGDGEPLLHPFETAYRAILAKHHNWFVEKFYLVGLAMLPTKEQAVQHLRARQGENVAMTELMASLQLIVRELDELTEAAEVILEESGVLGKIPTQVVT